MENTRIEGDAARVKQNVAREKTTYLVLTSTAPYYTIYYNSAGTAYELYGVKQYSSVLHGVLPSRQLGPCIWLAERFTRGSLRALIPCEKYYRT